MLSGISPVPECEYMDESSPYVYVNGCMFLLTGAFTFSDFRLLGWIAICVSLHTMYIPYLPIVSECGIPCL